MVRHHVVSSEQRWISSCHQLSHLPTEKLFSLFLFLRVITWQLNRRADLAQRQLNTYIRTASFSPEGTRERPPRTIGLLDEWLNIPLCSWRSGEEKEREIWGDEKLSPVLSAVKHFQSGCNIDTTLISETNSSETLISSVSFPFLFPFINFVASFF